MESHLRLYLSAFLFHLFSLFSSPSSSPPLPHSPLSLSACLTYCLCLRLSHLLSLSPPVSPTVSLSACLTFCLSLPPVFSPVAMLRVWKVPVPSERCSMSCRALVAGTAPQKVSQFNLELLLLSPLSVPPPLPFSLSLTPSFTCCHDSTVCPVLLTPAFDWFVLEGRGGGV